MTIIEKHLKFHKDSAEFITLIKIIENKNKNVML